MTVKRLQLLAIVGGVAVAACQGHLPPLETSPNYPGPKVTDVVTGIRCELAQIVNASSNGTKIDNPDNARLSERVSENERDYALDNRRAHLVALLPYLAQYHFVASAQLSLEVTDTEGFSPSLSFINKAATLTSGLGGQLTGTQDRSVTINYVIDLASLSRPDYKSAFCLPQIDGPATHVAKSAGVSGGIAGDLGLADTISDGLLGLDSTSSSNLYGSSGPTPPIVERKIAGLAGVIAPTDGVTSVLHISSLDGTILFSPQSAASSTQGTVTLSGVIELKLNGVDTPFVVNWSGTMVPPDSDIGHPIYFSVAGNLTPAASGSAAGSFVKDWGFNPAVTLTGTINRSYDPHSLALVGSLSPVSNSSTHKSAGVITIPPPPPPGAGGPGAAGGGAKSASASASSAGTTTFGSVVDFTLVFGLNGGPNWTFKQFKGPAGGSSPLLTASRTNLDTLSITFVPACQNWAKGLPPSVIQTYWDSIASCDEVGAAQQSASMAYQANSLMILKTLLQRPGIVLP